MTGTFLKQQRQRLSELLNAGNAPKDLRRAAQIAAADDISLRQARQKIGAFRAAVRRRIAELSRR